MKKILALSFVLVFVLCFSLLTPSGALAKTFVDDCGREVDLPDTITRTVATGPMAQIILFAIAPDTFVGLADAFEDSAYGLIPEEYFDLPFFGQLYGSSQLNIEQLALADPQVIVDIGAKKKSTEEDLNTLQDQTAIPTVFISASLDEMPACFRKLGTLLGREARGEELARFCERVYDRTASIMEKVGDDKVNGLYVVGEEGLHVLAKTTYQAQLFDMLVHNIAVVENPLGRGTGNEVSMEQIALWNPDFILFQSGSIYDSVRELEVWQEITAIRNENYIEVPHGPHDWMGSPPSVQQYLCMIWLTAELYPQYCDYDVKAEIKEFYRLFYGCELTDAQYDTLMAHAFLKE